MNVETKDRAHDKAFANIYACQCDIKRLKAEVKADITPFITQEQNIGVLELAKKELKTWNYLAKLIEMDYKYENYLNNE
jgi:hypothetical protein